MSMIVMRSEMEDNLAQDKSIAVHYVPKIVPTEEKKPSST